MTLRLVLLTAALLSTAASNPPAREPPANWSRAGIVHGTVRDEGGAVIANAQVTLLSTPYRSLTDSLGRYRIENVPAGSYQLRAAFIGYRAATVTVEVREAASVRRDITLLAATVTLEEITIESPAPLVPRDEVATSQRMRKETRANEAAAYVGPATSGVVVRGGRADDSRRRPPPHNTEEYALIRENDFLSARTNPLSTFSIDVDKASYANVRRFLISGRKPPIDAVRVEELVNYFPYDYAQPTGHRPFSIAADVAPSPWHADHRLVRIALQGARGDTERLPPSNLVFLIDVSGSMQSPDKLPLVKQAFGELVRNLRPADRVAIVVYAGSAGLVLPSTDGEQPARIMEAIRRLEAGGSTAGGAGIRLAYAVARAHFLPEGNNRVILATDGDFNVGASSESELVRMIEAEGKAGIHLTVLGFGTGNYKDSRMESLADKGDGNYAYIDNALEAKKVFGTELNGTLFTIAKDVKIQVEFNPARVAAYRLVGYENRLLADEDFNDDTKDAGEVGAGHSVTALYEVVPVGVDAGGKVGNVDALKYQPTSPPAVAAFSSDWLTVKVRYQDPKGSASRLVERAVTDRDVHQSLEGDFAFAASVASYGLLLRESAHAGSMNWSDVRRLARRGVGADPHGFRAEFLRLIEVAAGSDEVATRD